MNDLECTHNSNSKDLSQKPASGIQNILVFQQNGSGIKKIEGIYPSDLMRSLPAGLPG
jgi:hypothetical protein